MSLKRKSLLALENFCEEKNEQYTRAVENVEVNGSGGYLTKLVALAVIFILYW